MKLFLEVMKSEILMYVRDKKLLALFLCLPILAFLVSSFMPYDESMVALPIGISIPEGSERGEELLQNLKQEVGVIEFIETTESEVRKNVASGNWECGYILDEDFDEYVDKGRYTEIFTLVISEGSTLDGLVSEAVSSAMLTMIADDIGRRYLENLNLDEPKGGYVLEDDFRLEVLPVSEENIEISSLSEKVVQTTIQGFMAIVITVIAISLGDRLSKKKEEEYFVRIASVVGKYKLIVPILAVEFLLLTVSMTIILLALGGFVGIEVILFSLCMTALTFFISSFSSGFSAVMLPFVPPLMLAFTPVFIDISTFYSFVKPISYIIPATHYINSMTSGNWAYIALILLALFYIVFGIFIEKIKASKLR